MNEKVRLKLDHLADGYDCGQALRAVVAADPGLLRPVPSATDVAKHIAKTTGRDFLSVAHEIKDMEPDARLAACPVEATTTTHVVTPAATKPTSAISEPITRERAAFVTGKPIDKVLASDIARLEKARVFELRRRGSSDQEAVADARIAAEWLRAGDATSTRPRSVWQRIGASRPGRTVCAPFTNGTPRPVHSCSAGAKCL